MNAVFKVEINPYLKTQHILNGEAKPLRVIIDLTHVKAAKTRDRIRVNAPLSLEDALHLRSELDDIIKELS